MSKPQDRHVVKRPDGQWSNTRQDATRPSSVHPTQREAEQAARANLRNQGGGELITHDRHGRIRSKDTIPPGNDPCPPRDKEH